MFWKLVREPLRRSNSRRRALWAVVAISLGTAIASAMLSVSLDVGDRIGSELRSLGANIVITPAPDSLPVEIGGIDYRPVSEGAYIAESSLPKLKKIFWRNNILAFAPYLYAPARVMTPERAAEATLVGTWFEYPAVREKGEEFTTGILRLNPTWRVEGALPDDGAPDATSGLLLGRALADQLGARVGDNVQLSLPSLGQAAPTTYDISVTGILTTGGEEDGQAFVPLDLAQAWAGLPDQVRKVQVSALIKPEDELSRRDPARMTPAEYDRWYCSPYVSSIVHQIGQALPDTSARAVRQVSETQGGVLSKLTFLMALLAIAALLAAGLSISSLASLTVLERRQEIGLMKALGAQDWLVASLFLSDAVLQGVAGGVIGFFAGHVLAKVLGGVVFGAEVDMHWLVLPAVIAVALMVSLAGTWAPVRHAVREIPSEVLRSV